MKKFRGLSAIVILTLLLSVVVTGGCGAEDSADTVSAPAPEANDDAGHDDNEIVDSAVSFSHSLGDYQPRKKEYNFYFTYKLVHSWWDAVAMGLEDAMDQYAEQGITINRIVINLF